ncbi:CHAT domain-containing protein [Nocardia sp. CC201C]|uniref:CHAT domain-containing protein n=1 Tax=Nocardia sp. CC201C TaxID=3044575 RepID=UPI0024A8854D|nr:CHAT domain-containing protein [Nocardia sp. CC201C]
MFAENSCRRLSCHGQLDVRGDRSASIDSVRLYRSRGFNRNPARIRPSSYARRSEVKSQAEKLRVLILGAAGEGDLRVGREQKRIRAAVQSALHRDQIMFDVRPAATPADLLDGISKFRPHVVHFSGHSDNDFLVFEQDTDGPNSGIDVAAGAFARAIQATDAPPLLVLLNSCNSAAQIDDLVAEVVPFAIGMADEIDDGDAINYAAQFYASIADGQSIKSSHLSGRSALELAGLSGADLPTLACAPDVDPSVTILVKAME